MLCEEITIAAVRTGDRSSNQASHDLTQRCNVILGLGLADPLDTEKLQSLPQFRERTTVQRAAQIVGCVGQQLALAQSGEQVEIFAGGARLAGSSRGVGQRRMRNAERCCV